MTMCMMETLRFQSPATNNSSVFCKTDVKLGKYQFQKGDRLMILIDDLHYNPSEWREPHKFDPSRFDPSSEMSLTPSGKKRNPYSWVPFNGGARICFGKTFAEVNMKYLATYMTQLFEAKLEAKYDDCYPMAIAGMTDTPPVYVTLTKRTA